jgi:hypothetical protein
MSFFVQMQELVIFWDDHIEERRGGITLFQKAFE